jgi:hypothetical protein
VLKAFFYILGLMLFLLVTFRIEFLGTVSYELRNDFFDFIKGPVVYIGPVA